MSAESSLKFTAVGVYVFRCVPFHEAEVEDSFAFEGAAAAGTGAEAVHQPGQFRKWRELENGKTLGFVEGPGVSNFA